MFFPFSFFLFDPSNLIASKESFSSYFIYRCDFFLLCFVL
uniref:Uncharacterized protein n=1 Tax=Manihot esculenta TaxID=3983 RepID=A0A2C9VFA2_MANES